MSEAVKHLNVWKDVDISPTSINYHDDLVKNLSSSINVKIIDPIQFQKCI